MQLHFRYMIRVDIPGVVAIDGRSFVDPWESDDFLHWLRVRNCIAMVVCTPNDAIVGSAVYTISRQSMWLRRFAIAPERRRTGVGSAFMAYLAEKLQPNRRHRILFDLADDNLAGHLFLRANGFKATDVSRDPPAYRFIYDCRNSDCQRLDSLDNRVLLSRKGTTDAQ